MWCYPKILKVQLQRVTNANLLRCKQEDCEVIRSIKVKRLEYLGYLTREETYKVVTNSLCRESSRVKGA